MKASELIKAMESAYSTTLPEKYKNFLNNREYIKYPEIKFQGYIRGSYDLDFMNLYLADVNELGIMCGISDMDDVPWKEDYSNFIPLAALSHSEIDEPQMFLVLDVKQEGNPVLLFDQKSNWALFMLANSFESFLENLPEGKTDHKNKVLPNSEA